MPDAPRSPHPPRPALPPGFVARLRERYGGAAGPLLEALERPPQRGLRTNTLRLEPDALRALLPWRLRPLPWSPEGFVLDGPEASPGRHPLHRAGAFYLQDPAAMRVAHAVAPEPGGTVLDLAAAPGGKATHLAALLRGAGTVVANEVHPQRALALLSNVERLGVPQAVVSQDRPERLARAWGDRFDAVLLDAPCSGEGMFRKLDEARSQWSEGLVRRCAARQHDLLDAAARLVRPGGVLVYSTCTFAEEEDERVVEAFLGRHHDFLHEPLDGPPSAVPRAAPALGLRLWPHEAPGEGHFLARLRRSPDAAPRAPARGGRPAPVRGASPDERAAYRALADEALGGDPLPGHRLLRFRDALLAVPAGAPPLDGVHLLRAGVLLGRVRGGTLVPAHALAMVAGVVGGAELALEPGDPAVGAYLAGRALPCGDGAGWRRVTVAGLPLGWGYAAHGTLRNALPSGLRDAPSGGADGG